MSIEIMEAEWRKNFHAVDAEVKAIQAELKPLEDEINDLGASDAPSKARIEEIRVSKQVIMTTSGLQTKAKLRSKLAGLLDGKTGVAP